MALPRITIITPSFQQAAYLEECLHSLHDQGYPELEHIVVDGGSTDGSKAILERWSPRLAAWWSEPDGGQSAAINKGLAHATGEVFAWLNSDDLLLPGALDAVAQAFADDPELLLLTAPRLRREADGSEVLLPADVVTDEVASFVRPQVSQQSTFIRMDAVKALGGVEARLHHVMDLELWWQLLFRHGVSHMRTLERPLSVFRMHGESKSSTAQQRFVSETAWVLHGLCLQVGATALAGVLASGHECSGTLRPFAVDPAQRGRVEHMTLAFLLRWHRHLFTAAEFRMMRGLRTLINSGAIDLHDLGAAWRNVDQELNVPGWWAYRLRRKWRSLTA